MTKFYKAQYKSIKQDWIQKLFPKRKGRSDENRREFISPRIRKPVQPCDLSGASLQEPLPWSTRSVAEIWCTVGLAWVPDLHFISHGISSMGNKRAPKINLICLVSLDLETWGLHSIYCVQARVILSTWYQVTLGQKWMLKMITNSTSYNLAYELLSWKKESSDFNWSIKGGELNSIHPHWRL